MRFFFPLAAIPSVCLTKVCAYVLTTHLLLCYPINCLAELLLVWNITCQGAGIRFCVCLFQDRQIQMSKFFALLQTSQHDLIFSTS